LVLVHYSSEQHELFSIHRDVSVLLPSAGKRKGFLRKSETTREFYLKIIINQDAMLYVHEHTRLNIYLTHIDNEVFSIAHFLSFYHFYHILTCFI